MRRWFLLLLVSLLATSLLFLQFDDGGGYLLIAMANKQIEMSLLVASVLNILLFVALFVLLRIIRAVFGGQHGLVSWARKQRSMNRTTQGLIAFVEGRWDFARKMLARSAGNSPTPLINYLFAARASSGAGDSKAVDGFLKQAELSTKGADVAIGLTQAELQIQNNQFEQALATLIRVKKIKHKHPEVLRLLLRVYCQLNDWDQVLALLPSLKNVDRFSADELLKLARQACCEKLKRAASLPNGKKLLEQWRQLPNNYKKDQQLVICYVEQLILRHLYDDAEQFLAEKIQHHYHIALVSLYGDIVSTKLTRQLTLLEKLLPTHASDAVLLLAVGKIHLALGNLESAEEFFKRSFSQQQIPEAAMRLGRLYAQRGQYQKSSEAYAKALPEKNI